MNYTFDIIDNIEDIPADEWNAIGDNHGMENHQHIVFKTRSRPKTFPRSWVSNVVVKDQGRIIAKASPHFIPYHLWLSSHQLRVLSRLVLGKMSAITVSSPPVFANGLDYDQAAFQLLNGLERLRRKKHALAIRITNLSPDDPLSRHLKKHNYCVTTGLSNTVMTLKWSSFDDYLLSYKKKRRYEVKRQINACKKANIKIEINQFGNDEAVLYDLMQKVAGKHKSELRYRSQFISENEQFFKESVLVITAKHENRIIGSLLVFKHDNVLRIDGIGLDYDLSLKHNIYRLLFYKIIEFGIENQYELIYGGASAYDIKCKLGFVPLPTNLAVWVKSKVFLKAFSYTPPNMIHKALPAKN